MTKEFSISFEFERGDEDVEFVNQVLSRIPLSTIKIDSDGYLATIQQFIKNDVLTGTTYNRYGFDSLKLSCTMDETEGLHYYQIETQAIPASEIKEAEDFKAMWDKEHPDRVIRVLQMIQFNESNVYGFVILHHKKIGQ